MAASTSPRRVRVAIVTLALLLPTMFWPSAPARAQVTSDRADLELWMDAGLHLRMHRQWRMELTQHVRLNDDVTHLARVMTDIGFEYRPTKAFRLGVLYRFMHNRELNGTVRNGHRIQGEMQVIERPGRVRLSQRLRWQSAFEPPTRNAARDRTHTLRFKFGLSVDTDTVLTPFVSGEAFVRFLDGGDPVAYRKTRVTGGVDFELARRTSMAIYYRFELIERNRQPHQHILGISFEQRVRLDD